MWGSHHFKESQSSEKIVKELIVPVDIGMRGSHDCKGNHTYLMIYM